MMVTGIFGGSFNPIHLGHILLGEALVKQRLVDELWFVVSPQNPFKVKEELLADEERFRLVQLAVEGRNHLQACDVEFRLPRPSYMVHTLECLRELHPGHEFVLVIGADNWERFPQWYQSEEIMRRHRLIVYPRPGHPLTEVPKGVTVAHTPLLDISSTDIRRQIASGGYRGKGLPRAVWQEIRRRNFYAMQKTLGRHSAVCRFGANECL